MMEVDMSYYDNKWFKNFKTKLVACNTYDNSELLELEFEDTIFFPGGGGQPMDRGFISLVSGGEVKHRYKLEDIREVDNRIKHIVSRDQVLSTYEISSDKISSGDIEGLMELDWDHRIDGMQQHTGQHLLSGCFYKLFKANTKGLHIGKDVSQLDIDGEFTDEMVKKLEDYANDQISRAINIKNYVLKEGDSLETRRPLPSTDGDIRILEIEDLDINACCGLHLDNTRDITMVKIKRYYKHKSGTRFEYLAGKRAVDYLLKRDRIFDSVLNKYSAGEDNIIKSLENIEKKKDDYYNRSAYLLNELIKKDMEIYLSSAKSNAKGLKVIISKFDNEETWYLDSLAKHLVESGPLVLIFANKKQGKYMINFMASKTTISEHTYIDLGKLFKSLANEYPLKGGGSKFSASGVYDSEKNIDILLDNVYDLYIGVL